MILFFLGHKTCEYCGQTFVGVHRNRDLETHLKRHEKPSEVGSCPFCNKSFKFNSKLARHQKTCRKRNTKKKKPNINIESSKTEIDEINHK